MQRKVVLLMAILAFYSCKRNEQDNAQEIVDRAIEAHGGQYLSNVRVAFSFRDIEYSMSRNPSGYVYTRSFEDSLGRVRDVLVNSDEFTRTVNGDTIRLSEEWARRYSSSVNSVLYFMQLPYLLNDEAVKKEYKGETTIGGEPYYIILVTFEANGGGEDHDDEYMYWIHQDAFTVDYFAYNYQTDGGGVRFREAINRTKKGGILFQDYINYKVEKGTPLIEIPEFFEAGKLRELSRIENENIEVKKLN